MECSSLGTKDFFFHFLCADLVNHIVEHDAFLLIRASDANSNGAEICPIRFVELCSVSCAAWLLASLKAAIAAQ